MKIIYKLSNPNYRQKLSTVQIMQDLMIAVCGLAAFTVVMEFVQNGGKYGAKAIGIYAAAIITGLLTDYACGKFMKRNDAGKNKYLNTILSPVVTSTIFALTLPIGTPLYVVVIGAFIAIFFGKAVYGGFGKNIFNPALVGRVIVHLSFSSSLVAYLDAADAVSGATPTAALAGTNWVGSISTSLSSLYLGNYAGALGETWALLIIVIGVILAYRKVFDWRIPVSYVGTVFILALVSGCVAGINPLTNALTHIALGGIMFGAVFMATDPVTSPTSPLGKIIYGIALGTLTMLIRLKGTFPEGVLFSILLMNMFTPMIDNFTLGRTDNKYGKQIGILVAGLVLGAALIGGVSTGLKPAETKNEPTTPVEEKTDEVEELTVEGLKDGTYTGTAKGFGDGVVATITVEGGKITDCTIEGPNETPTIGGAALEELAAQVKDANGNGIDGVSGATMTSNGVKEAVANAIKNASAVTAEGLADGEYTGKAKGFGGDVEVTITVADGKITDVKLAGDSETPTIGGAALEDLAAQIKEANGNAIDGVSGATMTSNGAKGAVEAALAGTTEEEEETPSSDTLADGTYTATARGFGTDLKATITIKDGKITSCELEGPNETPTIGGAALEELQEQVVKANGTEIDGVSGATMTSNGVKDAVEAALKGGN